MYKMKDISAIIPPVVDNGVNDVKPLTPLVVTLSIEKKGHFHAIFQIVLAIVQ
jgi:hypothetical protein